MTRSLEYYMKNYSNKKKSLITLLEKDISGGRIAKNTIDKIKQYSKRNIIEISGLTQETFNYFLDNYAHQFECIKFWKCPLIEDLSRIKELSNVKCITYYWNQRVEKLWDFSKTTNLKAFSFNDFTRMHYLSDIANSYILEELQFGNMIWDKYILETLEPITRCQTLKVLNFSAKKIIDNRIEPLAQLKNIQEINFSSNLFTTEQIAWLKAHLPKNIKTETLLPYWKLKSYNKWDDRKRDTIINGKRKPFLSSIFDKDKISKYVEKFNVMYNWFYNNLDAKPEDYKKK